MKYLDLDVDLFDHRRSETDERFRVRVSQSPGGSQKIRDAIEVEVPSGLADWLSKLERRDLDARGMIELGKQLGDLLFPREVRSFLKMSLGRLKENERLRVRIRCDDYALAEIPWEFSYVSRPDTPAGQEGFEGFLALDGRVSIVRHEVLEESPVELKAFAEDETLRVGILLSNPQSPEFPRLDVEREAERIVTALKGVENIESLVYPGGSLDELEQMAESQVHLFHFAGHGEFLTEVDEESRGVEGRGRLILVDEGGKPLPVPAERVARNLKQRGVRLVVLSACEGSRRDRINAWTGIAPALIREGIPAVVGMQATILDASAVAFSESFYATLLQGEPVDAAVTNGRQAIANAVGEADRDWGVPVLYLRTDQDVLFPIRRRVARRYIVNLALLSALILVSGVWFYQHWYYYLLQTRLVQALAGLGTLFAILALMFRPVQGVIRGVQEGAESRLQAFLDGSRARTILALALAGAVLAYLTTSSLYVFYTEDSGRGRSYSVRAVREGDAWARELHVSPNNPTEGDRFFLRFGNSFTITAVHPSIFQPTRATAAPWWPTVHLDVPGGLLMKDQTAFRLVPEPSLLFAGLPQRESAPLLRHDLVLSANGRSDTLRDVRFQTVLIAADRDVLAARLESEGGRFDDRLNRHLDELGLRTAGAPESIVRVWLESWRADTAWITPILADGSGSGGHEAQLWVEIVREGSETPVVKELLSLSPPSGEEIETIFLTVSEGTER